MQPTLETHAELLLGKWLMGQASAEESRELQDAARADEGLREAMALVERSSDPIRHCAIGEAAMIDTKLPSFSRPQQLAATLETLHTSRRRILVVSLTTLGVILGTLIAVNGASLWTPNAIVGALVSGLVLAFVVLKFGREDAIHQLTRLQALESGEPWLEQVQAIERTRRRYASRHALYAAAGILAFGITLNIVGTAIDTPVSEAIAKFGFIASIFVGCALFAR